MVTRTTSGGAPSRTSGQAIVFLVLAMTALIFVLLLNVDLHRIIQRKDQTQNAGDSAALAAARWQGASLNLVGELNLLHALALCVPNAAAVDAITNMQARICFTGPLTGLFAAQIAAKNNHMYVDDDMTGLLTDHAATVRDQYAAIVNGQTYFAEPWTGAWQDYADMLDSVASDGIAAGPDNAQFYLDPSSGHMLYEKAFYEAVLGANWCWFYLNARNLLSSYTSYHDWPPLPDLNADDYTDSEIFGLGLRPVTVPMKAIFTADALADLVADAQLGAPTAADLAVTNVMDSFETWYFYSPEKWTEWTRIQPDGDFAFPIAGPIRDEYNYAGADAVVRVYATVTRMTPGLDGGASSDKVLWTSAAKPFGYLETDNVKDVPMSASSFVLPAFRNVRLIPIDAASGSGNSSSDAEWVRHVKSHLKPYLDNGPSGSSCRYCQALAVWEKAAFRQAGIDWLDLYCNTCQQTGGGGSGRGGGSPRGH